MNWVLIIFKVVSIIFFSLVSFQSRAVPDTAAGLIEYFLDTEAQELEFEIARLRPR